MNQRVSFHLVGLWYLRSIRKRGDSETILLLVTCTGASVAQVRGDSDGPALVHAHAPQTFIDAFQQATLAELGHFSVPSLMAAEEVQDASLGSFWGRGLAGRSEPQVDFYFRRKRKKNVSRTAVDLTSNQTFSRPQTWRCSGTEHGLRFSTLWHRFLGWSICPRLHLRAPGWGCPPPRKRPLQGGKKQRSRETWSNCPRNNNKKKLFRWRKVCKETGETWELRLFARCRWGPAQQQDRCVNVDNLQVGGWGRAFFATRKKKGGGRNGGGKLVVDWNERYFL